MQKNICGSVEKWIDGISNEELGALVREYVKEANHSSWDGWEFRRLKGAFTLLRDMWMYWDGAGPGHWASKVQEKH
jgi:hypothetical protein